MAYIDQLMAWNYLVKDESRVSLDLFKSHIKSLTYEEFIEFSVVFGYEARDLSFGNHNELVAQVLNFLIEYFETQSDKHTDQSIAKFNLGMSNASLFFCKRFDYNNKAVKFEGYYDLRESINYLRRATKHAEVAYEKAESLTHYQVTKTLDYITEIFNNYTVERKENIPSIMDLESTYVFLDQLDSDTVWNELYIQMEKEYGNRG